MSPVAVPFPVNVMDLVKLVPSAFYTLGRWIQRCMGFRRSYAQELTGEMDELKAVRADTENAVIAREAQAGMRRTEQVVNWMKEVDSLVREVDKWSRSGFYEAFCFTECSCWWEYHIQQAQDLKNKVSEMKELVIGGPDVGVLEREMRQLRELRDAVAMTVEIIKTQSWAEPAPPLATWLAQVAVLDREVESWLEGVCKEPKAANFLASQEGKSTFANLRNQVYELKTERANMKGDLIIPAEQDADTLAAHMNKLKAAKDDVLRKVESKEEKKLQLKHAGRLKIWLESVASLETQSIEFPNNVTGRLTFHSRLREIQGLLEQKTSIIDHMFICPVLPPPVEVVIPCSFSASSIPCRREALKEIQGYVSNDDIGIVGIYGMGGIGKTTLLKIINNELLQSNANNHFDVVIWVTVSRNLNVNKIQADVSRRLGMNLCFEDGLETTRIQLYNALLKKHFLLLLDDVWERLDLVEDVGIPLPDKINRCKVVLTTRSREVCNQMGAKKVKLNQLSKAQSRELFCRQITAEASLDHSCIQTTMEKIVAKCGGLPLALNVVGRAMANTKSHYEWEDALEQLKQYPDESSVLATEVCSSLKCSFDRLENDMLQQCFLYCSLFPMNKHINVDELIEQWMAEGFIDSRNRGHTYVRKLEDVCLLESGMKKEYIFRKGACFRYRFVKMHCMIHRMALGLSTNEERLFLSPAARVELWGEARRVSMRGQNPIKWPSEMPDCRNLQTLLLMHGVLKGIPAHIFNSMAQLRMLDISHTSIKVLPLSIGSLVQLRYLNLSHTYIKSLPQGLSGLVELRQLHLESTPKLKRIPRQIIPSLTKLQILNMSLNFYSWHWKWCDDSDQLQVEEQAALKDLERLEHLNDLRLLVCYLSFLKGLSSSTKLQRSTTFLEIIGHEEAIIQCHQLEELRLSSGQFLRLEYLGLSNLPTSRINVMGLPAQGGSQGISHRPLQCLRDLQIEFCRELRDITFASQLPYLQRIRLVNCDGMEEMVVPKGLACEGRQHGSIEEEEKADHSDQYRTFQGLEYLELANMKNLRSICQHPLHLPCLEILIVRNCPKLRKLRLQYTAKLTSIRTSRGWWDALDWDQDGGQAVKSALDPYLSFSYS